MCQVSSLMAAAEGPVAEFSSFANLEEKKMKPNLLMSFPKTGNQMGSFGQIRKNSFFRFCRPILDIFGLTLLITVGVHPQIQCIWGLSTFFQTYPFHLDRDRNYPRHFQWCRPVLLSSTGKNCPFRHHSQRKM